MRVVAGEFGSRTLVAPAGETTRPTTDRVRESMYSSIISELGDLAEVHALDAFAGSGALGIEGLSRGLASCTFYETDRRALEALRRNLSALGLRAPRACGVAQDVFRAQPAGRFGLLLVDPPYRFPEEDVLRLLLGLEGALVDEALIVYEHALERRAQVAQTFENTPFTLLRQKKYGKTGVTYLNFSNS